MRNLLQGEPGKEAQFYNSALARVDFGQTYKGIIEGYDAYIFSAGHHHPFVEGEPGIRLDDGLIEDVHDLALAEYFMSSQPIRERLWPGKISLY